MLPSSAQLLELEARNTSNPIRSLIGPYTDNGRYHMLDNLTWVAI